MTETQRTYDFNWKVPTIVPSFIEGTSAEAFLGEFNGRVDADYNGNPNLKVLNYKGEVVTGSNPFAVVLANEILRPQGIRTATPADLGRIVDSGVLPLKGKYVDSALVIRTNGHSYEPNDSLAKDMFAQIRDRGVTPSPDVPVMVPLNGLDLVNADNGYGLGFKLSENTGLIEAPELSGSQVNSFDRTNERGLPVIEKKGSRTLFTRNEGLARLSLGRNSDLSSDWDGLGNSSEFGRVVLVSGEAGAQNFSTNLRRLNEQRKSELDKMHINAIRELNIGYQKALNALIVQEG